MNYEELFSVRGVAAGPTRAALIGVGQFGRTLFMQSRRMAALDLAVLCDLDVDRLVALCRAAGLGAEAFAVADSRAAALRGLEAGRTILTADPEIATAAPVDVVVEATGDAEAGARNVVAAIAQGRHVVLVTKETDCVVGPLLAHRAKRAGLVLTQVDGDQPSLLLGLVSWARTLELGIACAGKASEYDFVFDSTSGTVGVEGLDATLPFDRSLWTAEPGGIAEIVGRRAEALSALPRRTPPDFCEMCIVANASRLKPDRPDLHAPIARATELPDLLRPRQAGGILGGGGRLDIFNCLRRPDEISFAGGVFAVLEAPDPDTGRLFEAKGIPVSDSGGHLLVYNPTHLLGAEAPISILLPHRLGIATGSTSVAPVCDVTMRATDDLAAGTALVAKGSHHRIDGVEPLLLDYAALTDGAPLPYFMGVGRSLVRDVRKGETVTPDAIEAPADSPLWSLRAEQDRLFRPS